MAIYKLVFHDWTETPGWYWEYDGVQDNAYAPERQELPPGSRIGPARRDLIWRLAERTAKWCGWPKASEVRVYRSSVSSLDPVILKREDV